MLAKLENGKIVVARGKILKHDGWITSNPKEKDFIDAGYKPVEEHKLPDKEGFYQVPEYTETEEKIIINYHYEELTDEEVDA